MLGIPRSALYYKGKKKLPDIELESEIERIFKESRGNYGTRKIKIKLEEVDIVASRRKIGEVMRKHSLVSNYIKHRPKQTRTKCNNDNYPNILNREFDRNSSLDVVVSDLTYVRVAGTWNYICLIVDLWNREIVGFAAGKNKTAELVYEAIKNVPYNLNRINIFHTDRGSEFKNKLIDDIIKRFNFRRSLSSKGTPLDNAVIESTNHILKTEFIKPHGNFSSLEELKLLLWDYVHWYNYERLHGSLNYMTPIQYRRQNEQVADTNIIYATSLKKCTKKG